MSDSVQHLISFYRAGATNVTNRDEMIITYSTVMTAGTTATSCVRFEKARVSITAWIY